MTLDHLKRKNPTTLHKRKVYLKDMLIKSVSNMEEEYCDTTLPSSVQTVQRHHCRTTEMQIIFYFHVEIIKKRDKKLSSAQIMYISHPQKYHRGNYQFHIVEHQ